MHEWLTTKVKLSRWITIYLALWAVERILPKSWTFIQEVLFYLSVVLVLYVVVADLMKNRRKPPLHKYQPFILNGPASQRPATMTHGWYHATDTDQWFHFDGRTWSEALDRYPK